MKRPAFQFYPGDWRSNSNLRRCTHLERGVWIDVMCLMHDSEEYGVLRWPLEELAEAVGCKPKTLKALATKGVLKGADKGHVCQPFTYRPRHAGKDGDPVTLVEKQQGPIWFSSRMVKDEHLRQERGKGSRFGATPMVTPDTTPKGGIGGGHGAGASSSSSVKKAADAATTTDQTIWGVGVGLLSRCCGSEDAARRFLGKHAKANAKKLAEVVAFMSLRPVADPRSYIEKAMQSAGDGIGTFSADDLAA